MRLPVQAGNEPLPAYFPATRAELTALTDHQLTVILQCYGIDAAAGAGSVDANRNHLSRHLRIGQPPFAVV